MKRMEWWLLRWLVLFLVSHNCTVHLCKVEKTDRGDVKECMKEVDNALKGGCNKNATKFMENLEKSLEGVAVKETFSMSFKRFVAILHKPRGRFKALDIYANDSQANEGRAVTSYKVKIRVPREVDAGPDNTIVFCMFTWPEANMAMNGNLQLHDSRMVGLSVRGKNISGLQERVNITIALHGNETDELSCAFYNFTEQRFSSEGCQTLWKSGQRDITCSCDHLTYFGVLMGSSPTISTTDLMTLTYITLIGCSLSLFALVITVLLFFTNKKARADVSMKVHINLAISLILLNLHFLPNQAVAALPSTGLCLYMALCLHYSLLATFSWMALEGFHLYILLVKVFNIYVRRYLLKLSVVGWGVPAVIVLLVVIIDGDTYGRVSLDSANPNSTEICYISNNTVKMVTTVGVFALVFVFNMTMFGVTVRRVLSLRKSQEFGQSDRNRAKREICTLLGVTTLLGITWGLVFFTFGNLNTPGLYLFCILNPLQGFFIFLWFVMSLRKTEKSATVTSAVTGSTNS